MNVHYEKKQAMTFIGYHTEICPEEGYQKCPEFWDKEFAAKYARLWQTMKPETEVEKAILENGIGMFAIYAESKNGFEYWIAGMYHGGDVPEGLELYAFPASDWAVFTAKGPMPGSLQTLNTAVWQEWFPKDGQRYHANGTATLEVYSTGNPQSPDYECGIWVPVLMGSLMKTSGVDCADKKGGIWRKQMSLVNETKLNNNYERAVSLITSTCAPREEITSRAKTYDFIMKVYSQFMDNSEGLGLKRLPDATFTRWEPQKGREKDVKAIRDANDKVMSFMEMLLDFIKACKNTEEGLCALKDEVKLNSLFFKVLDKVGIRYIKGENICFEKEIGTGLIQLADYAKKMALDENGAIKHDREITFFSRIVFDNSTDWLIDGFDRMINADGSLKLLGEELSKRGFYREIYVDGRRLTLNYLKNYEKKPGPLKMSFGERSRLGFEVGIEDMRLAPGIISLRLPFFCRNTKEY